jgi:hypothetical protein
MLYDSSHTVFFFARSPDAPNTTITVFSLSSIVLRAIWKVSGEASNTAGGLEKLYAREM